MDISGIGGTNGNWSVPGKTSSTEQPAVNPTSRLQIPQDSLEISESAQLMMDLQEMNENNPERAELIARIQAEIAQGTYDTDEKMELALMKFINQADSE